MEARLGPRALLEACEAVYASHNAAQVTLDTHLEQQLAGMNLKSPEDQAFISEAVYGMYRYSKFLTAFLNSFYHHNSGTALRKDAPKYRLLAYLAAFWLPKACLSQLRALLCSREAAVVLVLLEFMAGEQQLQEGLRQDLLRAYDKEFVDSILAGLQSLSAATADLREELRHQVCSGSRRAASNAAAQASTSASSSSRSSSSSPQPSGRSGQQLQLTQPQPFNLSQPRPKPLPVEEEVPPRPPASKPPPPRRNGPTAEELALEQRRAENRAAIAAKYSDPKHQPFKLAVHSRPMHLPVLQQEAEEQLRQQMAQSPATRPVPPPPSAEVRLTAAAVLREDALYRRKQAAEAAMLQQYEAELRDASEYDRWQTEMRAADEREAEQRVSTLRQTMSVAQGAAMQARQELLKAKAEATAAHKEEVAARREQTQQERQAELQQKMAAREQIVAARAQVAAAQQELRAEAAQAAEVLRRQQQEVARAAAAQKAAEMAERRDLILRLRALEKAPRRQAKVFDRTAVHDVCINDQMSLVELRERLRVLKQRAEEEKQQRRNAILEAKQKQQSKLADTVQRLHSIHALASAQALLRRTATAERRTQSAAAAEAKCRGDALVLEQSLAAKRQAKAREAERIAAEEKRVQFEQMQRAAGASVVEEHKFRELTLGSKRAVKQHQAQQLQAAATSLALAAKCQHVRETARRQEQQERAAARQAYDQQLQKSVWTAQQDGQTGAERKQELVQSQRAAEARQLQTKQLRTKPVSAPGPSRPLSTMEARLRALAGGELA